MKLLGPSSRTKVRKVRDEDQQSSIYATLGVYAYGSVVGVSVLTQMCPEFCVYINRFLQMRLPSQGTWAAITVTRNVATRMHRDASNAPGSCNWVYGLGGFTGGQVWVESSEGTIPRTDKKGVERFGVHMPVSGQYACLDPLANHQVEPWKGTRWSIIAYTPRRFFEHAAGLKPELEQAGFPTPEVHLPSENSIQSDGISSGPQWEVARDVVPLSPEERESLCRQHALLSIELDFLESLLPGQVQYPSGAFAITDTWARIERWRSELEEILWEEPSWDSSLDGIRRASAPSAPVRSSDAVHRVGALGTSVASTDALHHPIIHEAALSR